MTKRGRLSKRVGHGLRRLRESRPFRRYLRPTISLLRWEGVFLVAALGFGLVSPLATRWFFLFIFLAVVFLGLAWVRAFDEDERGQRFRRRAQRLGLWIWGLLILLIGVSVFWRFASPWAAALFGVAYVGIAVWHLAWLRGRDTAAQFKQLVALSVTPILAAWIVDSTIYLGYVRVVTAIDLPRHADAGWATRKKTRQEGIDRWESRGYAPVAVTLSGGGYRAAVVHAGLLWALDRAGVPIHYLSTVSGGSIVGATYALGWSPAEFCDHLKKSEPGLPNDLANFYPVLKQLLFPRYGSGDTYASHFERVYFHGRQLNETGPPLLILNTTHYGNGTRRAFRAETDQDERLARIVAASGAFPVAFDPVRIGEESFMDGGVVENLGIAGLQHYFRDHARDPDLRDRLPGVLIISDVSLIPEDPQTWRKPSVPQNALYAQQTSYFAMHEWIYSFYTDGAYDRTARSPLRQPYEVEAGRLWPDLPEALKDHPVQVFVLSPTSPAERRHYEGHETLVDAVSSLPTLRELAPGEVDAAFWLGARLAQVYLSGICAAAGASDCDDVKLPEAPPVPPT